MRLGYLQKDMLEFLDKYTDSDSRFFHIAQDRDTRRVALSLEKRGLIKIINNSYECWVIRKAKS